MILNLPATVEMATPNIYADQIEWFGRAIRDRDSVILSVHPHNDRGTAVAAAELALMAGADRVEGTLFGNGERTGNVDIVTLALNLFTQGVDPALDITDINEIKCASSSTATSCPCTAPSLCRRTGLHRLLRLASGRDQEGLRGSGQAQRQSVGRALPANRSEGSSAATTRPIIRINSQSGKGGIAYLLKADHGLDLPRTAAGRVHRDRPGNDGRRGQGTDLAGSVGAVSPAFLLDEAPSR